MDGMAEERRAQLPEVLETPNFGFSPLHKACADGDLNLVRSLLKDGADIRAVVAERQATPLHIAAEYEKEQVVGILLEKLNVSDLLVRDHEGDTPLHIAAGNLSILQRMLEIQKHQESEATDSQPQEHQESEASASGNTLSLRNIKNHNQQTLLHYAAGKGSEEVVAFLLKKKVDKLAKDHTGATPFHFGARGGSVPVMEKLKNQVEFDEPNCVGLTALHYAAWNGREEVVKWLLINGASVSIPDRLNGDTPLHWAARNGSAEVISCLIEKGADMSAKNLNDELPLNVAVHSAISTLCKAMITSPAFDPLMHRSNATLLHFAAAYGSQEEVELVLQKIRQHTVRKKDGKEANYKINVNLTDKQRQNAFHWAASKGNASVIETLKRNHVDPFATDEKKRTPLRVALIENQLQFAGALLKCLGENLSGKLLSDTLNEEINREFIEGFRIHIKGSPSEKDIITEIPAIYKILHANNGKEGISIAKFVQENNKGIFEFVNSKGKITDRTALHWATILQQKSIVSMLCKIEEISTNLAADTADYEGKTPLEYATTQVEIVKELMGRPEVQAHVKTLYKAQKVYQDFSNAILVGATMIVGITSSAFNPPVFWNISSLISAFLAVFVGIFAMRPVSEYSKLAAAVKSARLASILAAHFLALSFSFLISAYYSYRVALLPFLCVEIFSSWQLFKNKRSSTLSGDTPSPPVYLSPGPSTSTATTYKFGDRHAYIRWEDGLDKLALAKMAKDIKPTISEHK